MHHKEFDLLAIYEYESTHYSCKTWFKGLHIFAVQMQHYYMCCSEDVCHYSSAFLNINLQIFSKITFYFSEFIEKQIKSYGVYFKT